MNRQRILFFREKIINSRFRIFNSDKELAAPLYSMDYCATKNVYRISTNGECVFFNPDWLSKLDNVGLDFMLSHQAMHIKLGHINRSAFFRGDRFHLAADIVANALLRDKGLIKTSLPHVGKIFTETFFPKYVVQR